MGGPGSLCCFSKLLIRCVEMYVSSQTFLGLFLALYCLFQRTKKTNYQIQTYFWDRQLLTLVVEISAQPEIFFGEVGAQFRRHHSTFFAQAVQTFGSNFGYQIWSPKLEPKICFLLGFKCIFVFWCQFLEPNLVPKIGTKKKIFFRFSDVRNAKKNRPRFPRSRNFS